MKTGAAKYGLDGVRAIVFDAFRDIGAPENQAVKLVLALEAFAHVVADEELNRKAGALNDMRVRAATRDRRTSDERTAHARDGRVPGLTRCGRYIDPGTRTVDGADLGNGKVPAGLVCIRCATPSARKGVDP